MRQAVREASGRTWMAILFVASLPLVTVRIYAADELQYFAPLRSLWFDRDLDFRNEYAHFLDARPAPERERRMLLEKRTPTGLAPSYAPVGTAIFWLPFYAFGDLVARVGGWPRNGYSYPYLAAICWGSALYAFLGLMLLHRLAEREVSSGAATAATLLAWWSTALPFYMYVTPPMSHAVSLFAVSLFVVAWWRWRDEPQVSRFAALGILGGLMTLVREQNALFLLLPALDLASAVAGRIRRGAIREALGAAGRGVVLAVAFGLVLVPQLLVWHELFGRYAPSAERMSFFQRGPRHLIDVLVSSNHGLLTWHPAWVVGLAGLAILTARKPVLGASLGAVFAAQLLFLGSVSNWAGGMAFGQRRLLDSLFVVAIGGAAVLERLPRVAGLAAGVLLVWWNLSLLVQFGSGMIPREGPVVWREVAYNQAVVVPRGAWTLVRRYAQDRESFYEHRREP